MRLYKLLLICVMTLFTVSVRAAQYSVENIPMVHLQDAHRYVSNPDGILSEETVNRIDGMLEHIEDSLTIETAVIVVESFDEDCWDIATQIGNKYGVGDKKKSNGLVITLATADRCVAFSTGDGMEGVMPDAVCHSIQERYMNGYFKDGKWDEGMLQGVSAVCQYLAGNADESVIAEEPSYSSYLDEALGNDWVDIFIFILAFWLLGPATWVIYMVVVSPLSVYRWWTQRECPECGKHSYKSVSVRGNNELCHCDKCGYEQDRRVKRPFIPLKTWYVGFYDFLLSFANGGGGGSFGGGGSHGSGGGHFGGGSHSGGGARSRF